jgi:hypothetical protein
MLTSSLETVKSMRRPSFRLPTTRRPLLIGCGILFVGGLVVVLYISTRPNGTTTAPTYDVVLPQRTPISDLGGWQRVSPEGKDPVFAYNDTVEEVAISVSQQPLPASFVGNVDAQVKQLAESYSASTVIDAGGTKVYIGRSARGPQSVIFAKNNTLVLIKSQKTISQAEWTKYINNLVDPKTEETPTF